MLRFACIALVGLLLPNPVAATEPTFPELTGRVVDEAGILSATEEGKLSRLLEQHERETSNQVVVVTLKSLQGLAIEDFGSRLGNHWGIGQEGRNNGVLLIVAHQERKIRIEVGLGLEDALTDVLAKAIIETEILPRFREDNFPDGIHIGAVSILKAIEGAYEAAEDTAEFTFLGKGGVFWAIVLIVVGYVVITAYRDMYLQLSGKSKPHSAHHGPQYYGGTYHHIGGFGVGGGGFGGGGFGGGGGGFGGGGASGSW